MTAIYSSVSVNHAVPLVGTTVASATRSAKKDDLLVSDCAGCEASNPNSLTSTHVTVSPTSAPASTGTGSSAVSRTPGSAAMTAVVTCVNDGYHHCHLSMT